MFRNLEPFLITNDNGKFAIVPANVTWEEDDKILRTIMPCYSTGNVGMSLEMDKDWFFMNVKFKITD